MLQIFVYTLNKNKYCFFINCSKYHENVWIKKVFVVYENKYFDKSAIDLLGNYKFIFDLYMYIYFVNNNILNNIFVVKSNLFVKCLLIITVKIQ